MGIVCGKAATENEITEVFQELQEGEEDEEEAGELAKEGAVLAWPRAR